MTHLLDAVFTIVWWTIVFGITAAAVVAIDWLWCRVRGRLEPIEDVADQLYPRRIR